MARVTSAEVKVIRPTTQNVDAMIVAANLIVSDLNASCSTTFDETRLIQIELWLAAHFVGTIDPTKSEFRFENAMTKYQVGSQLLSGILSDKYGQTANVLSNGCLVDFDKDNAISNFIV